MIDTIKLKIPCNEDTVKEIALKSTVYLAKNLEKKTEKYRIYKSNAILGSYEYGVNIFIVNEYEIFVELSIPKYIYGHNVLLFDCDLFYKALFGLYNDLERLFHINLPSIMLWKVYRLDFCYAWKFYDDDTALGIMCFLKNFSYSRKNKEIYDTSVMWKGSDYSCKFYMKGIEFFKHDFKRLKSISLEQAILLQELARGVVRYEITYHHDGILQLFDTDSLSYILKILDNNYIYDNIQQSLLKIFHVHTHTMSYQKVFDIISRGSQTAGTAVKMFTYYRNLISDDPLDHHVLRRMPRTTRWRYNKKLRLLKVGLPVRLSAGEEIDLSVPSKFSVGKFPLSNTGGNVPK